MEKMKSTITSRIGLFCIVLIAFLLTINVNAEKVKFILMGDTQHIMNTSYGDKYKALYKAFENLGSDPVTKDVVALLSMGDMIETGRDNDIPLSYKRLKAGLQMLDIPYVIAYGNNDKDVEYDKTFPKSMFEDWPSYVGVSGNTRSIAHQFSAGGVDWLVISIRINPSGTNMTWAENLVKNNPKKNVILINHDMSSEVRTLAKKYKNVVLAACGHTASQKELWTGTKGNKIGYIKHNWHSRDYDHYFCLVTMDTEANTMTCRYYSPADGKFGDDESSEFWSSSKNPLNKEEEKNNYDHPWTWSGFDFGADPVFVADAGMSKTKIKQSVRFRINDRTLNISVPVSGEYNIKLISLSGATIGNIHRGNLTSGTHELSLSKFPVSAGIYLVQVDGVVNSVGKIQLR